MAHRLVVELCIKAAAAAAAAAVMKQELPACSIMKIYNWFNSCFYN
jgi:hypothetical protein